MTLTPRTLRFLSLSAVFFIFVSIAVLYYRYSLDEIKFNINGKIYTARLRGNTVADALDEADVLVESADEINPALDAPLSDGMTINIRKAAQVAVEVDGQIHRVYTHATDPMMILSEANVQVGEHDEVLADGMPLSQYPERRPRVLQVIRAVQVTVDDSGVPMTVTTTAQTVGGALQSTGISLYVADEVSPGLDSPLENGMTVIIQRSKPVTILMDGREIHTRTTGKTVQDALAHLGIALSGMDYVIPHETDTVEENTVIRIVRVTENYEILDELLPYHTLFQPDPSLILDTRAVLQPGQNGLLRKRFRIRMEDGQEVSRVLLDSWIEESPVDEVVAYGTQIQPHILSTESGEMEYWRVLTMKVSTYRAETGSVAVDKNIIPPGTSVYITDYGKAVATDTLPEGSGMSIALGYDGNAIPPWHGTVEVYLLTPLPEEIPYLVPVEGVP